MWPYHWFILNIGISLAVLIFTAHSLHLLREYLKAELLLKVLGEESKVEKRMLSRMKWKSLLDIIGPTVCIFFWFGTLLVRMVPKDYTENQYRVYYFISKTIWQILALPYLIVSLAHSVYLMLVLLDDTGFIHGETSNTLFEMFKFLASGIDNQKKLHIINTMELLQLKYACCGGTSYLNWLDIDFRFADESLTFQLTNRSSEFDPWGQKSISPFFPTSCCDRSQNIKCATSLLRPSDELTVYQMTYEAPVYKRDCAFSIYTHTYQELFGLIAFFSVVDIFLHFLQMIFQIKCYFKTAPRYPCIKWNVFMPPLQSKLTPPKMGSRRESTGSVVHRTGSITHMDGSRTHQDGSITKRDGTFVPIPDELYHRSGSITVRSGSRIHRTGSRTHTNGSRTHRTGSVTYADGTRVHRDQTISLGPGDTRDVCMKGEKVKVFFGSAGYISTEQILQACQGTHLLAQPSHMQLRNLDLKSYYLRERLHAGWLLRGVDRQYSCIMQRLPIKRYHSIAPTQASEFRLFLRIHLPMIEAIIYADGNSVIETEANSLYRSFCVYLIRGALFLLFGFIAAEIILSVALSMNANSPLLSVSPERHRDEQMMIQANEKTRDEVAAIYEEVRKQTSFFIYTTVMVASLVSRRVRCVLLLALPGLGLAVGWAYLSNEMLHSALIGPVANVQQNIFSVSDTLMCFAEASHNMTRDFDTVNQLRLDDDKVELEYADVIGEDSPDFRNASSDLMKMISDLRNNLSIAVEEYAKLWPSIKELEDAYGLLIAKMGGVPTGTEIKRNQKRSEIYDSYQKQIKSFELPENVKAALTSSIKSGAQLESVMSQYVFLACKRYQDMSHDQCLNQSRMVCDKISELIRSMSYRPAWYTDACWGKNYEAVCPKDKHKTAINTECNLATDTLSPDHGFGVHLQLTRALLDAMNESIQMDDLLFDNKSEKWDNKTDFPADYMSESTGISCKYPVILEGIFYFTLIGSTLTKLLFLWLIVEAHNYISNYILDAEYDNVYVGRLFEIIDAKRLFEFKETLLPLKSMETDIYWRRKCYTMKQFKQVIVGLIVTLFVGVGLRLLFAIDYHFYEMVTFLIDLTSGYHGMRAQSNRMQFSGTDARVLGSGIFQELTSKLLLNLGRLKNINLNYDQNFCSPYLFQTHLSHEDDFFTAWYIQAVVVILGPYLLRCRHCIAAFFYPSRSRSRTVTLYNSMLVRRRRHMTMCRNLVVHWTREGRLQREARRRSEPHLLEMISPRLAGMLSLNKRKCIICQDYLPPGPDLLICPVDHTATCQQCASMVLRSNKCITCLDRNPRRLFKERRKIQRSETMRRLRD
ncbi:unnamed protein product [Calicophoron daubneyi]|uniref:Dendritic cell-specific transmembrane protein-like domain-containing protein n=1 Tax=Calicophoron daubneyi TaxID=300641 RepID=A0AAV2TB76_CALDB